MKTSLCDSCEFGLIREWDCDDRDVREGFAPCTESHLSKKCLVDNETLWFSITSCNHHKKAIGKVTYHDPDFDKFEAAMDEAEDYEKKTLEVL